MSSPLPDLLRELLLERLPDSWQLADLEDDLAIFGGGLGLDSVAVVELLCACEDRLGITIQPDALAGEEPATIGSVIGSISRSLQER